MRLTSVMAELDVLEALGDPAGTDVVAATHDSGRAGPGTLFCCIPGRRHDGHDHAPEAVARGATALLCERLLELPVPQIRVGDARSQTGRAASAVYGHPSRHLAVVGITGTNGKTTTAALLAAILRSAGRPTGLMGTLSGSHTTPESPDLQAALASWRDGGRVAGVVEVSSHALALSRVEGTRFALAVFTNLGRDHLDFHASQEDYFRAKASLFDPERAGAAVINIDDPWGRRLAQETALAVRPCSLADVADLEVSRSASTGTWEGRRLHVPLGGRANVANAVAAATTALELGVDAGDVVDGLAAAPVVPGRFEEVRAGQPFTVVVDYAHTPEGLEQLLRAAREVAGPGRVHVVFGCGGDRDRHKRPVMGELAARLADGVVLTSDNPRREDPDTILAEVAAGTGGAGHVEVEPDRRAAIGRALALARPGDVVLVAGKGHESVQIIGERVAAFDDRTVVAEELDRLGLAEPARSRA